MKACSAAVLQWNRQACPAYHARRGLPAATCASDRQVDEQVASRPDRQRSYYLCRFSVPRWLQLEPLVLQPVADSGLKERQQHMQRYKKGSRTPCWR